MLAFVSEAAWLRETSPPASGFHLWPFGEHEGCWSFNSLLTPSSPGKLRAAWERRAVGSWSFPTAAARAAPCPLHPCPWGGGEESSQPGCSAFIRLTPGLAHPYLHLQLLPGPAQGCRERGPHAARGGRVPWAGAQPAAAGRAPWDRGKQQTLGWTGCPVPSLAPACLLLGAGAAHRCARLHSAVHWCLPAWAAAGCHALVPVGMHGCVMPCVGVCQHAWLRDAVCWCPPTRSRLHGAVRWCPLACPAAQHPVLVPTGVHSRTVPCVGTFQHPALPAGEHAAEQTPCPSSCGRQGIG